MLRSEKLKKNEIKNYIRSNKWYKSNFQVFLDKKHRC